MNCLTQHHLVAYDACMHSLLHSSIKKGIAHGRLIKNAQHLARVWHHKVASQGASARSSGTGHPLAPRNTAARPRELIRAAGAEDHGGGLLRHRGISAERRPTLCCTPSSARVSHSGGDRWVNVRPARCQRGRRTKMERTNGQTGEGALSEGLDTRQEVGKCWCSLLYRTLVVLPASAFSRCMAVV